MTNNKPMQSSGSNKFRGLVELMECPACGKETLSFVEDKLLCKCGSAFQVKDGILDLMGGVDVEGNFSQAAMRFNPLIRIYDVIWRHMTFPFVTNIPLSKEVKILMGYQTLKPGYRLLDIACGPGTYSRRFAHAVGESGRVVGADASMPMLRQAVKSAKDQNLENVIFLRSAAENLPFRRGVFDGANCTGALHLFSDIGLVLGKIHRTLKPGGVFTCMTFRKSPIGPLNVVYKKLGVTLFDEAELKETLVKKGFTNYRSRASRLMLLFAADKAK